MTQHKFKATLKKSEYVQTRNRTHRLAQNGQRLDVQLKLLLDGSQMHQATLGVAEEGDDDTEVSLVGGSAEVEGGDQNSRGDAHAYFGDSFEFVRRKQRRKLLRLDCRVCGRSFAQRQEVCPEAAAFGKAVDDECLRHLLDLGQGLE